MTRDLFQRLICKCPISNGLRKVWHRSSVFLFRYTLKVALPGENYNNDSNNSFNYFRTVTHSAVLVHKLPSIYNELI